MMSKLIRLSRGSASVVPILLTISLLCSSLASRSQAKTDRFLEKLIRRKADDQLKIILNHPDSFRYQLIYTKIDRNKDNEPAFRNYYLHVDPELYFNPASMVKLPTALIALEKLNDLSVSGLDRSTPMLTDSGYEKQTAAWVDSTAENGLPSLAHYIKKVFLVSDNEAYNRLYEFVGQELLNKRLWEMGYHRTRIVRRFVTMTEDQNRHTNPIRFIKDGKLIYQQPALYNTLPFDFSRKVLIGNAHYNREDSLIHEPMDFTTHNNFPLEDMQQVLQAALFPRSVPAAKRFRISENDYRFLLEYMAKLPSQSDYPRYDTSEFFDSYTKFFLFKAGRSKIPEYIQDFNKTGWSYGFLTDVAYIRDTLNKVEFMLSGTIYTNRDGILNDDKYEYEETGYPFFKKTGEIIYNYELSRKRKYKPKF
jgi:hypothetical protein